MCLTAATPHPGLHIVLSSFNVIHVFASADVASGASIGPSGDCTFYTSSLNDFDLFGVQRCECLHLSGAHSAVGLSGVPDEIGHMLQLI